MNFYSVRDLRTDSKSMWADLNSGDEVVLTNNGKPSALIIDTIIINQQKERSK